MALYLVQNRIATQDFGGRKWSNRYFVDALTEPQAHEYALEIWRAVKAIHNINTYCYETYANRVGDAPFTVGSVVGVPVIDAYGTLTNTGRGELLPSSNVIRIDFPVVGSRPSRKFFRPCLREGDTVGDSITGADLLLGLTDLKADFRLLTFIRDVDGESWITSSDAIVRGVTSRRFGREAALAVPPAPSV